MMISRSCLYRLGLAQDDLDFVPVPYAKVKHRRGSQGKNALEAAPVLDFQCCVHA